jgi:hypothetical protein
VARGDVGVEREGRPSATAAGASRGTVAAAGGKGRAGKSWARGEGKRELAL